MDENNFYILFAYIILVQVNLEFYLLNLCFLELYRLFEMFYGKV